MPSQESTSPSPLKRTSLNQRTASTHSLSSSQKHQHKPHRAHVVGHRGPHGRNPSYGKNLNKLNRLTSNPHIQHEGRNHQRKRSGPTGGDAISPKANLQRNISQISLPRAASQASIKKNHSVTSIPRNTSEGKLKKLGLAPLTPAKRKEKENTVGGFQLGDNSSSEEEAEWEDSSASPETTRKNSTVELAKSEHAEPATEQKNQPSPGSSIKAQQKSAPSLASKRNATAYRPPDDAPNLLRDARSSRAPPAMSSVAAFVRPSSNGNMRGSQAVGEASGPTTATSSVENGVSRFINGSMGADSAPRTPDVASDEDDDYDSPSSFLPHYHPQAPAASPSTASKSASGQISRRPNVAVLPSRTQQRLELQRRETMRSSATTPEGDPVDGPLALRARSASRGRSRGGQDTAKAAKRDYEAANAQLGVIKRYRNPTVEALYRLQDLEILPKLDKAAAGGKSRPVSRAGSRRQSVAKSMTSSKTANQGAVDGNEANGSYRVPSRGRVRFERQGSHDDIGLSRSDGQEVLEDQEVDGTDAANAEEALLRRMWESREVYEAA